MKRVSLLLILALALTFGRAEAFWIWTPKTGKWVNPKTAAKSSPAEQLKVSQSRFDAKDYKQAKREFTKLIKYFPKSKEASEAQYYLGRIEEESGRPYEAYKQYQKVIDKYPFSERISEIIEREYRIGEEFMSGAKRKFLGMSAPVENPAIEIFEKVVENSSYGPYAAKAQYNAGLILKGLLRYYEAEEAFDKVVSKYPSSEWAQAAKYQLAECRSALSKGPEYDQEAAREAKEKFEDFVKQNPKAELSQQARDNIKELQDKEAESRYNIARFYEKQKNKESARIYYKAVVNDYPKTEWSAKSLERLSLMEKEK